MDGTLLDLHFDNYFWHTHIPAKYAKIHNIALKAAQEYLHPTKKNSNNDKNKISAHICINKAD